MEKMELETIYRMWRRGLYSASEIIELLSCAEAIIALDDEELDARLEDSRDEWDNRYPPAAIQ